MEKNFTSRMRAIKLLFVLALTGCSLSYGQGPVGLVKSTLPAQHVSERTGTSGAVVGGPRSQICPSISSIRMLDMTYEMIIVTWDNPLNFYEIRFRFTETGSTAYRYAVTAGNPNPIRYTIGGLASQTSYDIEVATVCTDGSVSDWSAPITVTTLTEPGPRFAPTQTTTRAAVNPNPATSSTTLSFFAPVDGIYQVVITTASGEMKYKEQRHVTRGTVQFPISVTNYLPGLYFINVTGASGTFVEKLIVQ